MRAASAIAAASLVLGIGCDAPPPPPSTTPPFRIEPTGPGLDPESAGAPVDLFAHDERVARVRVQTDALRIYDGEAGRIGRVRVGPDGWVVERRDGSAACAVVEEGSGAGLSCGLVTWRVSHGDDGLQLSLHDGSDAIVFVDDEGSGVSARWRERAVRVDAEDHGWIVSDDAGGRWQVRGDRWPAESTVPWAMGLPGEEQIEGSGDVPLARAAAGWLVARRLRAP